MVEIRCKLPNRNEGIGAIGGCQGERPGGVPTPEGRAPNDIQFARDHFREMLLGAINSKQLQAKTVLFDSWYGSWQNLKLVHRLELTFFTTLKANRLVSLSKAQGYIHLDEIEWTAERRQHGVIVKLQKVPFLVRLFKIVATDGSIDWVITNHPDASLTAEDVQNEDAHRWQVEQLHRELKQLTGIEKCQCRKQRSQRNHIACCYQAWLALKVKAVELDKTLYAMKHDLLFEFLRAELRDPLTCPDYSLKRKPCILMYHYF